MSSSTQSASQSSAALETQFEAKIKRLAEAACTASAVMGELSTERKNAWLARVASRLESGRDRI
ncbi:MAG: hypothetical protein ACC649_08245, partial [Myxococcota bacterium]